MKIPLLLFVASTLIARAETHTREALCDAFEKVYASGTEASVEDLISPARLLLLNEALGFAIIRTDMGGLFVVSRNRADNLQWDCSESMAFSINSQSVLAENATLLASDPQAGDFSVLLETNVSGSWIYLVKVRNVLRWNLVTRNTPGET